MIRPLLPICATICAMSLAACTSPSDSGVKAIVGARLDPGPGYASIPYSVIVIEGGKIRALGPQAEVPVPKGAEITRGNGKLVRPLPSGATLAPGKPADLVLRDASTGAAELVMHNGDWIK